MRPLICRQFHVLETACTLGEDPAVTRPQDLWAPAPESSVRIAAAVLQGLGHGTSAERLSLARTGAIVEIARKMHTIPLENIAETMDAFDAFRRGKTSE